MHPNTCSYILGFVIRYTCSRAVTAASPVPFRQAGVHDGGCGPGGDGGGGAGPLPAGDAGAGVPSQREVLVLQPEGLHRDLLPQAQTGTVAPLVRDRLAVCVTAERAHLTAPITAHASLPSTICGRQEFQWAFQVQTRGDAGVPLSKWANKAEIGAKPFLEK